jgi:hypothetical protein
LGKGLGPNQSFIGTLKLVLFKLDSTSLEVHINGQTAGFKPVNSVRVLFN